jgi:hypothetical protein
MLAAQTAWAMEDAAVSGVTVALPGAAEGWTRKDGNDGVLLQKSWPADPAKGRTKPGAALIQIAKPVARAGSGFAAAFERFASSFKPLARERPITKGTGITVNGHSFTFDRRCCGRMNGIRVDSTSVGVEDALGDHFLMLVTLGLSGDDAKAAEAEFEAVVRSLRPNSGDRAFGLVPAKDGGGLEGAYSTLSTGLRPNAFGGVDFYADNDVLILDRSGLYSREMPKGGLGVAEHCRTKPVDCGLYRLTGGGYFSSANRIEMLDVENAFGMLKRTEEPLARTAETLTIGKTEYKRLTPFPKGTPFEGTWRYAFAESGSGAFTSGSVAVERTLILSRDGRFRRNGFVGFSSSTETGGGRTGVAETKDRPAEEGRYEVEGHVLTLTGEGGHSERFSIFEPDRGSDGLLVINGANYLKQDSKK